MHYMEVDAKKNEIFTATSFLTFTFGFRTYIYYGPWNYSLVGRWHFSGDTLVLEPQYQLTMNPKNDSIHVDYLWTIKQRNEVLQAKPMKCILKGKELYILPNDEPYIIEHEDGSLLTFPPDWRGPGYEGPRRFVKWRKMTHGNPLRYYNHLTKEYLTEKQNNM